MNIFDYDLDRFAKALNIKGFDLVLLLDHTGVVLAEKSQLEIDRSAISEHLVSLVQIAHALSEITEGGPLHTAYLEFRDLKLILGLTSTFVLCGIPSGSTPQVYAKNEIGHALKALM